VTGRWNGYGRWKRELLDVLSWVSGGEKVGLMEVEGVERGDGRWEYGKWRMEG
jgi:hypothetical protein